MSQKKIYSVVVNHNGRKYLRSCLGSLSKVTVKGYKHKIILIDNGSMDGSVKYVKKKFPKTRVKIFHRNKGFTGAVNFALQYGLRHKAKYVLILNNDIKVYPSFLQHMVSFADHHSKAGVISPLILYPGKNKKIWFAGGEIDRLRFSGGHLHLGETIDKKIKRPYISQYLSGCALLIKCQVIEKIGLFDDRFFLYYEDVDYSLRAQKEGFKCYIVPKAKIVHIQNPSILDDAHKEYYLTRNHLLLLDKHASLKIKIREHVRTVKTAYEKLAEQEDNIKAQYALMGIKDYLLRRFGKREHWY